MPLFSVEFHRQEWVEPFVFVADDRAQADAAIAQALKTHLRHWDTEETAWQADMREVDEEVVSPDCGINAAGQIVELQYLEGNSDE